MPQHLITKQCHITSCSGGHNNDTHDLAAAEPVYKAYAAASLNPEGSKCVTDTALTVPLPAELLIPALNWRTAKVLGLPIPPPLNIAIRPNKFEVSMGFASR